MRYCIVERIIWDLYELIVLITLYVYYLAIFILFGLETLKIAINNLVLKMNV